MLKLSLHSSTPRAANPRNCVGRLDVAYDKLAARADYKALMWTAGLGEQAPVRLENYPRWSASVWDLLTRVICLSISAREEVWPADIPARRTGAFTQNLCAVVEHWPNGREAGRTTVASAHIQMCRTRCNYRATFSDDILGEFSSAVFRHTPEVLNNWDLLTRAYGWATVEGPRLAPRPELYKPLPVLIGSQSYVHLDTVREPARTGCYRWVDRQAIKTTALPTLEGPCVTETEFVTFLQRAI